MYMHVHACHSTVQKAIASMCWAHVDRYASRNWLPSDYRLITFTEP